MAEEKVSSGGSPGGIVIVLIVVWGFFLIFLYNNLTSNSDIGTAFAKDPLFGSIISFFRWLW